ncbi:hypothetical protein CEK25_013502 [Fusarium fujikuroi]|nr:hypothetical protein CEK25_013502 [Fusarium fujikuroi]
MDETHATEGVQKDEGVQAKEGAGVCDDVEETEGSPAKGSMTLSESIASYLKVHAELKRLARMRNQKRENGAGSERDVLLLCGHRQNAKRLDRTAFELLPNGDALRAFDVLKKGIIAPTDVGYERMMAANHRNAERIFIAIVKQGILIGTYDLPRDKYMIVRTFR